METQNSHKQLIAALKAELNQTRQLLNETVFQLEEANNTLEAIRSGDVDALIISNVEGHQLYSLENSDLSYRIFIEQMTEGAVTLNVKGIIQYSNSRFAQWCRLPLEDVTGKPLSYFITDTDKITWQKLLANAWHNNIKGEVMLLSFAGEQMPVSVSLKTLTIYGEQSMSVIISDLTEHKNHQQLLITKNKELENAQEITNTLNANLEHTVKERTKELYHNQQYLTRILETMAEGVVIVELDGKISFANPMAHRIVGLKPDEKLNFINDKSKWQLINVNGADLKNVEHPLLGVMQSGETVFDQEIGMKPKDGDIFYISVNAAPIQNEQGDIIGCIGTFMDVTNRRKAVQQKDEFISVASHELRTPITTLKASLQLLLRIKDNPASPMIPKLIEQSNKSLNKVSILIDDLLNATKVTDGQLTLNKTTFKIALLIAESCEHIRANGEFFITTTGDETVSVNADFDKIDQVLVNFINNAVKYAPQSKQIQIAVLKSDGMVKVSVTDSGPGIPEEKLPFLFNRYYRIDGGGYQYSGLGLGLYISSEIIKRHNGEVGAESTLGKGSTFWFTLPV